MLSTQQKLLQFIFIEVCFTGVGAMQRCVSQFVRVECNGSQVYVASTVHKELADFNARVVASILR
jgi:hypothetical protein